MQRTSAAIFVFILAILSLICRVGWTHLSLYHFTTRNYNATFFWDPGLPDSAQFWGQTWPWLSHWLTSSALGNLGMIVVFVWLLRHAGRPSGSPPGQAWDKRWLGLGGALFVGLALARWMVFDLPMATDERAYHFQAELVMQGRLREAAPPFPESFQSAGLYCKDFLTSQYQPGWPAALALGKWVHLELACNCVWWLAILLLLVRLGTTLHDPAAGGWAAFLFAFSSCFWFAAWSDFPHLQSTALGLLTWDIFWRFLKSSSGPGAVALCIASWMLVAVTRVQDFPVVMSVPTCWLLFAWTGQLPEVAPAARWRGLLLLAAGTLCSVAGCLLMNLGQTGAPFKLPYVLYLGQQFSANSSHSVWRSLYNNCFYWARLGWWMPPFYLAALVARRPRGAQWALVLGIAVQVLFYSVFYANAGGEWGLRFYSLALATGCLLGGATLAQMNPGRGLTVLFTGWCLAQNLHTVMLCHAGYAQATLQQRRILQQVAAQGPSLIFVRQQPADWSADAAVHYHADFRPPIYAIWLDPQQNEGVKALFPQCRAWVLDRHNPVDFTLTACPEGQAMFSSDAYYRAGINYLTTMTLIDREKALDCLQRSLTGAAPEAAPKTLALIGLLQRDAGQLDGAAESMRQSLRQDPRATSTRLEYAVTLRQLKREPEARAELERVFNEAPNSAEGARAHQLLGR